MHNEYLCIYPGCILYIYIHEYTHIYKQIKSTDLKERMRRYIGGRVEWRKGKGTNDVITL